MKNLFLILFMLAGIVAGKLLAQNPPGIHQEKMKVFSPWVGQWRGEGVMQGPGGQSSKSIVDERIELKLDGTILVVEGIGKTSDATTKKETIVHHAFAVLSYNPQTGDYRFQTHLSDGRSTDAWMKVVGENKFQWGFDSPRGKVRYNIVLDPARQTWNETGEYSGDGTSWNQFFEMNLAKVM